MRNRVPALLTALLLLSTIARAEGPFSSGGPVTIDNDASCDLSLLPAATLLLPYFEVDITSPAGTGESTIFTVTNIGNLPQVAHVTLWTDFDYPVIDFNIYLTGYDVQSISLYDVIARGRIAPDAGTGSAISPVGDLSGTSRTAEYDNPLVNEASCASAAPVQLSQPFITRMQQAFTIGKVPAHGSLPACSNIGGTHRNAVGYATIDVVGACTTSLPTDPSYFASEIRFDNVLTGDFMQINGNENYAQASPMVHIRAIPEGGTPATRDGDPSFAVNSPRTFYSRFQPAAQPRRDARQPLPATFAARWISGGATGFETYFKIWREGRSPGGTPCSQYAKNAAMGIIEVVLFDEEENPSTILPTVPVCTPILIEPVLPSTSMTDVDDTTVFPPNRDGAVAGWIYMNLDYCDRDDFASQNWVVSSMRAEERFSVDIDALALGNGCSLPIGATEATSSGPTTIGPAPNTRRP